MTLRAPRTLRDHPRPVIKTGDIAKAFGAPHVESLGYAVEETVEPTT